MKDLNFQLAGLCQRNRDGSFATQGNRYRILQLCADEIQGAGYKLKHPQGLKPKHVDALLTGWQDRGLSVGTIKNRLSHLRWWAEKVGKASILPADNDALGVGRRQGFKGNRAFALDLERLAAIQDAHVRLALRLQAAFGLRREEALKFRPALADKGDQLTLKASWCKGGRARVVPILTARQRALLDEIRACVGDGSLIPQGRTYIKQVDVYKHELAAAGINNAHGLRHAYAQARYRALTGQACPAAGGRLPAGMNELERAADIEARREIAEELGHGRIDVTNAYLGGRR